MRRHLPTIAAIFVLVVGMLWSVPNIRLEAGQWIHIEFVVMFGICAVFIRNVWLKLFLLLCIVKDYTIMSLLTWNTLHTVVLCAVLLQILSNMRPSKAAILNTICGIAIANTALVLMQSAGYWMFFQPVDYQKLPIASTYLKGFMFPICRYATDNSALGGFPGFFGNIDVTSAFCAMAAPAFFRRKWIFFLPVLVFSMVVMGAMGGLAALCLVALVWVWINSRSSFLVAFLLISVFAAAFMTWRDEWYYVVYAGANRFPAWREYLKLMPGHELFGYGLGKISTFYPVLKPALTENYTHPHNEFVSVLVETGAVGLGLICGFLFSIMRKARGVAFYGLVASIGCALTIFNLHTAAGLLPLMYASMVED